MDLTGNPWIVDAADVASAGVVVWPADAHILQIEFEGYVLNDVAEVLRGNGKVFWTGHGAADLSPVRSGTLGHTGVRGLKIAHAAIPHGSIRIYHR